MKLTKDRAVELLDEMLRYEINMRKVAAELNELETRDSHAYIAKAATLAGVAETLIFETRNNLNVAFGLKLRFAHEQEES